MTCAARILLMRDRAAVARQPHKLEAVGSNPTPAPKFCGGQDGEAAVFSKALMLGAAAGFAVALVASLVGYARADEVVARPAACVFDPNLQAIVCPVGFDGSVPPGPGIGAVYTVPAAAPAPAAGISPAKLRAMFLAYQAMIHGSASFP